MSPGLNVRTIFCHVVWQILWSTAVLATVTQAEAVDIFCQLACKVIIELGIYWTVTCIY